MAIVYLNNYINDMGNYSGGGNSKYYINRIMDNIVPYLETVGISCVRVWSKNFQNTFNIRRCDLYMSVTSGSRCSNINNKASKDRVNIFYTQGNWKSKLASDITKDHMIKVCENDIECEANGMCPTQNNIAKNIASVLVHLGEHNTDEKSKWIRENIEEIGVSLAMTVLEYFGVPFCGIQKPQACRCKESTPIMARPNLNSKLITSIPEKSNIKMLAQWEDWYIVNYANQKGYVQTKYIVF